MRRARTIASLALAVVAAGCGVPGSSPTATPVGSSAATVHVSMVELLRWQQFRRLYGLRADVEWVLAVASSPDALDTFGVPLLAFEEATVIVAQNDVQEFVSPARGYGNRFRSEFAGAWIEGPVVVLAFTDRIEEHAAALQERFHGMVLVRHVRFSLVELGAWAADVADDADWFETIGAELVQASVHESSNGVNVHIRWPDPTVERRVRDRFGDTGWMYFTYDGPPPWTGPVGDLEITVVDSAGDRVPALCLLGTTDPRVQDERRDDAPDGRCFYRELPAVEWTIRVWDESGDETLHATEVFVVPAERATVVVTVAP